MQKRTIVELFPLIFEIKYTETVLLSVTKGLFCCIDAFTDRVALASKLEMLMNEIFL